MARYLVPVLKLMISAPQHFSGGKSSNLLYNPSAKDQRSDAPPLLCFTQQPAINTTAREIRPWSV
jgi:hypothetical protein